MSIRIEFLASSELWWAAEVFIVAIYWSFQ